MNVNPPAAGLAAWPTEHAAVETSTGYHRVYQQSPVNGHMKAPKRSRTESLPNGEAPANVSADPADVGRTTPSEPPWGGWAELENDPIIFSTLLREWGVKDVAVHEVVPLDAIFANPAEFTYGLIFLSRYVPPSTDKVGQVLPDVWFANQTSTFSCASLALLNIVNNHPILDLGPQLTAFREATRSLSSKDRGLALDSFEHVRNVHNSFTTLMDRMNVDHRLKEDAAAAAKKKAAAGKKRRRGKKIEDDDGEEDNGFHFVAYVPAHGGVWRMDGMEIHPQNVGIFEDRNDWLTMVVPDLQAQWETAAQNHLEFSLLSLVAENDRVDYSDEQSRAGRLRDDWSPFIAHMLRLHAGKGDVRDGLT